MKELTHSNYDVSDYPSHRSIPYVSMAVIHVYWAPKIMRMRMIFEARPFVKVT